MLDADRVKSQDVDLQRRDEDMADLREKLADSKRQIQQVHKEVRLHSMSLHSALLSTWVLTRWLVSMFSRCHRCARRRRL